MPDTTQPEFPLMQQDHEPEKLVQEQTSYTLHVRQEDGRWLQFLGSYADRDEMTRIQAYRLHDTSLKGEKRRVMRRVILDFVDEVEGDGPDETSAKELIKRNEENTKRLLEEEEKRKKDLGELAALGRKCAVTGVVRNEDLPKQDPRR